MKEWTELSIEKMEKISDVVGMLLDFDYMLIAITVICTSNPSSYIEWRMNRLPCELVKTYLENVGTIASMSIQQLEELDQLTYQCKVRS